MSLFHKLNAIDVNSHIEKKNGLSYLSWAWAWSTISQNADEVQMIVYENEANWNYHTDSRYAWVKVGIKANGIEHIEMLPVMDFRNKAIPLDNVTQIEVNKAIQRAATKAIARHGLGLYIYAGEDMPSPQDGLVTTPGGYKTVSKATDADKRQYWTEFKDLCQVQQVDAVAFLEDQVDMTDKSATHNTVVHWLREPELLQQQLINFKQGEE